MELYERSRDLESNVMELNQKTSWKEFEKIITKYGFKLGFEEEYYGEWFGERIKDKIVLYYHEEKGLLLFAESYMNGSSVNQLKVFGELKLLNPEMTKNQQYALYHCSSSNVNEKSISFEIDSKTKMFNILNILTEQFEFCESFSKVPIDFNILTSEEGLKRKLDFKELTRKRLSISDEKIKKILGV